MLRQLTAPYASVIAGVMVLLSVPAVYTVVRASFYEIAFNTTSLFPVKVALSALFFINIGIALWRRKYTQPRGIRIVQTVAVVVHTLASLQLALWLSGGTTIFLRLWG